MPKPYPKEFRDDVVGVARRRDPKMMLKQIAGDFGISESCLTNWLARADSEEGLRPGPTSAGLEENRALWRRLKLKALAAASNASIDETVLSIDEACARGELFVVGDGGRKVIPALYSDPTTVRDPNLPRSSTPSSP